MALAYSKHYGYTVNGYVGGKAYEQKPVRHPVRADSRGGRKRLGSSASSLSTPDP